MTRILLAIADPDLLSSAAALVQEGEDLYVADMAADAEEALAALRRQEVDVCVLHDGIGPGPAIELVREISTGFPETGIVILSGDASPGLLRTAMQAGARDVVPLPLSFEQLDASIRSAGQWARSLRERVAGEEAAAAAGLGGPLVALAGAKGGVGTSTVALHLALAAVRAAPGRPVCLVDFDLLKGDLRTFLDTPHRRSVVDLVEVAQEISVRHLQETLHSHRAGIRLLLAPEEGERCDEVDSTVARSVLAAVKARHALTVVDVGAAPTEAGLIAAEMAGSLLVVATPDVPALRGVKRVKDLWRRLQVREDDDAVVVLNRTSRKLEVQPDLARKVVGGRLAEATIPANFAALEEAANTGTPERLQDAKMREAFDALAVEVGAIPDAGAQVPDASAAPSRGLLARLGGERGAVSIEFTGLLPFLLVFMLGLWQLGLVGYTYVIAGHAAREGARELAVVPDDPRHRKPAYRAAAEQDVPKAWRHKAKITKEDGSKVRVSLRVPVVLPGLDSPFRVTTDAATVIESEPLPGSQSRTGVAGL